MFERRDIEVADQDRPPLRDSLGARPARHFVEEGELVREFVVDLRVRLVAAGRHVKIMDFKARGLAAQRRVHVAGIALAAELALPARENGMARDNGDAVIALLAVDRDVLIAELVKLRRGKFGVAALGLLQAENVGPLLAQIARHEADAQPHRIDVPCRNGEAHRRPPQGWEQGQRPPRGPWQGRRPHCPQRNAPPGGAKAAADPRVRRKLRRRPDRQCLAPIIRCSSILNSPSSGLVVRSTSNSVTTVW